MAASGKWQVLLTDLNGSLHGELVGVKDLKVYQPLMRVPTCTFTVPIWNPYINTLMDNDCLIKAYRTDPVTGGKSLAFHGPVVSGDENGSAEAQSVAVTAAGPLWRLSKRIIPGSDAPLGLKYPVTGELSLGEIAHWIVTTCNGGGMTGIKTNDLAPGLPTGVLAAGTLKNAGEALAEIASGLNTFEFDMVPIEPEATGSFPYIAAMNVYGVVGYNSRPDAIFEYGTSKANVASYQRIVSREGMLTKGYIVSDNWQEPNTPNGLLTTTADNVGSRGLFEDVVPEGGLRDNTLRTYILNEHIAVRKNPREIINFTCATGARPSPGIDFQLGDFVRCRAVQRGSVRFDAMFRVWGITYNLGATGNENIELELTPP